jgi:hypothetical protein
MVGPDASDPLLHACFNAQLLAYSTDPALLDRSTEILMIMLECAPIALSLFLSLARSLFRMRMLPAPCMLHLACTIVSGWSMMSLSTSSVIKPVCNRPLSMKIAARMNRTL